jgi:hypothetical protein
MCSEIQETVQAGDSIEVSVIATGTGPFTYAWSSSCGGEFEDPTAPSTIFFPDSVETDIPCIISVRVTDPCGRLVFVPRLLLYYVRYLNLK